MLISDNSPVRKIISILTLYRTRMQGYCDVYKWTILKRTSPEVKCLHPTSSRREMCTLSVSNVIYHKFSHGAAFYTLNGKNVNVMLECLFYHIHIKNEETHILSELFCITCTKVTKKPNLMTLTSKHAFMTLITSLTETALPA